MVPRSRHQDKAERKNIIVVAICCLLILASVFLILNKQFHWVDLKLLGGKQNPGEERDMWVVAIDEYDLSKHYVKKKVGEKYPLENPETHQRTLYSAYVCRKENILFMVKPGEVIFACPFEGCHSGNTGGAGKADMELDVRPRDYQEQP